MDLKGKVESVNDTFEELFGWNRMDVIGRHANFLPHVPLVLRFKLNRYLKQVKNDNQSIQYRTIRNRKSGIAIYVDVTLSPLILNEITTGYVGEYFFNSVYIPDDK